MTIAELLNDAHGRLFSSADAIDMAHTASHQANLSALEYQLAFASWSYSTNTLRLSAPTNPQIICAYCGTKQLTDGRCDSCGAPNRS